MPKNKGIVSIGLNVDYQKSLQEMTKAFKDKLSSLSDEFKNLNISKDVNEQFDAVYKKIDSVSEEFKSMISLINDEKLDAANFEKFQKKVNVQFGKIDDSIKGLTGRISDLDVKIGILNGVDIASGIKKEFDDLRESITGSYQDLIQVVNIVDKINDNKVSDIVDVSAVKQAHIYKEALKEISKVKRFIYSQDEDTFFAEFDDIDTKKIVQKVEQVEEKINLSMARIRQATKEIKIAEPNSEAYHKLNAELNEARANAIEAARSLSIMDSVIMSRDDIPDSYNVSDKTYDNIEAILKGSIEPLKKYIATAEVFIERNKEAAHGFEELSTSAKSFYFKDGAIQIPVEVMSGNLITEKLNNVIQELQKYANAHPIFAEVELLAGTKKTTRKKNEELADQLASDKNPIDLGGSVRKAYRKAIEDVESEVNKLIETTRSAFEKAKMPIHPDKDAFKDELAEMVTSSLKQISEENSGLNINKQLEELISSLKEAALTLSGTEGFKFGLDEDSIKRITDAIDSMANMIKRAFGVASDSEIASQWDVIENKFKTAAGEEGKLLATNKEHKLVIKELALEYKKYLDMGGTNELSSLIKHTQTVKNITKAYEKLNIEAKEAQDILDSSGDTKGADVKLNPIVEGFKADADKLLDEIPLEKEVKLTLSSTNNDVKSATKANKNLETQAGKTETAVKNEATVAETASSKFRKLAKEKGAAVVANRELAKAAKETADALEKEAKARKESGTTKQSKNAVNDSIYANNFLKWQNEIKQSLLDSGNYAEIYDAKINQSANGIVKFTAIIRDFDGTLKKFSATVKDSGKILAPSISDMSEKQAASFEKNLVIAERVREAIVSMDSEGVESTFLNREELEKSVAEIITATQALENLNTEYKVSLKNDGGLIITKSVKEANGEVKTFVATFDNFHSVLDENNKAVKDFSDVLEESFDSGKFTTSTKNFAMNAQNLLNSFRLKHESDSNFKEIEADLTQLQSTISSIQDNNSFNKFKFDLNEIGVKLKNIKANGELGNILNADKTFKDITEVKENLNSLFATMGKVNEKSIKVKNMKTLTAEVKQANGEIRQMTVNLDKGGFARYVDNGIVQFGRLREAAENVFKGINSLVRIYLSPQDFVRYFRQGFDTVKEIDTSLTELRKVSDASPKELAAYFGDATTSAKELGSSVNDMISATADWARMGYNIPDSKELGEVAVLYKNVGDGIDIEAANESLVSTLQGFQLEANDAERIIDSFNEVSNNFAISSGGIGEALKRSAAAFNAANTDLNQSIALITAGNEVVQNPEKVGTMWQTVSARIRGKICAHYTVMCRPPYEDNIKAA